MAWVPQELLSVLATALRIGLQSHGAFDFGVGDLVNAWGFGPSGMMELTDAVIATSRDYRHWVEVAGKHYAHTMSSSSRRHVCNRLATVTVVMSSYILADAWATALLALGETVAVELAQQRRMGALFVLCDGEEFQQISLVDGQLA